MDILGVILTVLLFPISLITEHTVSLDEKLILTDIVSGNRRYNGLIQHILTLSYLKNKPSELGRHFLYDERAKMNKIKQRYNTIQTEIQATTQRQDCPSDPYPGCGSASY